MERELVLRTIEETIGPFIGQHMAKASIQLHSEKLGLTARRLSVAEIGAMLDAIGKGMFVLVGKEKTAELRQRVEESLGVAGKGA
jgi:hypothetical protein